MKSSFKVMVILWLALMIGASTASAQGLTTGAATTAVNDGQTASQIDASSSGTIEYEGDYAYYIYEDGAVDLVKYNGSDENVVIPASFEGKTVVTISNEAFYAAENLKQVTIPEGVKHINYQAFKYCTNLTTVNLPTTLETIGTGAFEYCAKLTNLSLPAGLKTIEAKAFADCKALTTIIIPDGVTSIENHVFSYCTALTSAVLPAGINKIGYGAFDHCVALTEITIPAAVKSIGQFAFYYCEGLKNVVFGNGISDAVIDPYAFSGCSGLTSINLPNGVTTLGDYAFMYCSGLTSVTLSEGLSSIGVCCFEGCNSLTGITIPGTVNKISGNAFSKCTALTSVELKGGPETIDYYAFYDCEALTTINLPEGIKTIGNYAFADCYKLTEITIPSTCSSLGGWVFSDCRVLSRVNIPASVASIGDDAFIYSPLTAIYGISGSYAESYATANNIPFNPSGAVLSVASFSADRPSGQTVNTAINLTGEAADGTAPYQYCFTYTLAGATTTIADFGSSATATFQPNVAGNYLLTVAVKDANGTVATKTLAMTIVEAGSPTKGELTGFLGQDLDGNYYLYDKADFNNSYLAFQIDPSLAGAKMYQHFLTNKCKIVALKDLTRGYMDYNAAATASLLAQINLQPFDINAYFASSAATPYGETVGQVKIVDQGGNVL